MLTYSHNPATVPTRKVSEEDLHMKSVGVMLDIGAGNTKFVRSYRRYNSKQSLMYLCGEPGFSDPWRKGKLLANPKKGKIVKVRASYDDFGLPDDSLDIVSLNAPHPFCPPCGIGKELVRCLRSGGLFFSAHPVGWHPKLPPEEFYEVLFPAKGEGETKPEVYFRRYGWDRIDIHLDIGGGPVIVYPASPTLRNRLTQGMRTNDISYVYSGMYERPTCRVWVKT